MSIRNSQFPDPKIVIDPTSRYTVNDRMAIEREFVSTYGNCDTGILKEITDESGYIVPVNFRSLFMGNDLSESTQKAISCVINGLKANPDDPYLKTILKGFAKISEGSLGEVYLTEGDFGPLFVIKSILGKNPELEIDMLNHEAFVGLAAVNTLRKDTPNFIHTYGVIQCGSRGAKTPLTKNTWCNEGRDKAAYLAIEPVMGAREMQESVLDDMSALEFAKILIQIESALSLASQKFGYTHYDLHNSNVLIQQFGTDIYVPVHFSGRTYHMKTRILPRIIDYGMNFVQIGEDRFGFNKERLFKYLRSYPIRDTVELLLCTFGDLYKAIERGNDTENTHQCMRFIEELYPVTGGDIRKDYSSFDKDPTAIAPSERVYGNGELRWNPQWATLTHNNVLQQIRRVLGSDVFDSLLVAEVPIDGKIYNADSRSWFSYEGLLFDQNQEELQLEPEIDRQGVQKLAFKRESDDGELSFSSPSLDVEDIQPIFEFDSPEQRQFLNTKEQQLLEPFVLGTVDRKADTDIEIKTPAKLTFHNPKPLIEEGNDPSEEEIVKRYREEKRMLKKIHDCPVQVLDDITKHLKSLNVDAFTSLFELGQPKPDQQLQNVIGCLLQAMGDINEHGFDPFISSLTEIAAGSYGEVYLAQNNQRSLFVVKRSKGRETLDHEAFVGMAALNKVRSLTPAFVYTYGLFGCEEMSYGNDKYAWCSRPNTHNQFLFIENLGNARTMHNYLKQDKNPSLTYVDLLKLVLQVVSALNAAYKTFGFTHYDLHGGNVLIQELPYVVAVPIYIDDEVFYLETQYLARIIDYGASRIKIPNGKSYAYDSYDVGSSFRGYPATDLSVFLNNIFINLRGRDMGIPENVRMYELVLQLYGVLLGRDLEEDFKNTYNQSRDALDFRYESREPNVEKIRAYDDALRRLENFLHVREDDPDLNAKLYALDRFLQEPRVMNKLMMRTTVQQDFENSGIPPSAYNRARYLVERFIKMIREDRADLEQQIYRTTSTDTETTVFHNGYLVYQPKYAEINHDEFFKLLITSVGDDIIEYVLSNQPDPSARRTICTYDCKSWDAYRQELFT